MKIIIAKRLGRDDIAYINANRITSFIADKYDDKVVTKIYFAESKCEIEGDHTNRILDFMLADNENSLLDLTKEENKSYWGKEGKR